MKVTGLLLIPVVEFTVGRGFKSRNFQLKWRVCNLIFSRISDDASAPVIVRQEGIVEFRFSGDWGRYTSFS